MEQHDPASLLAEAVQSKAESIVLEWSQNRARRLQLEDELTKQMKKIPAFNIKSHMYEAFEMFCDLLFFVFCFLFADTLINLVLHHYTG